MANSVSRVWQVAVVAVLLSVTCARAADRVVGPKQTLRIEVEIERGKELSRITVYFYNDTKVPFSFATGAAGGSGSLDDRVLDVGGTAPTVVPVLLFNDGSKDIVVRAPAFGGPTKRSMRPAKWTIAPGQRQVYASFAVPSAHVRGKFVYIKIHPPEQGELLGFADALIEKRQPPK